MSKPVPITDPLALTWIEHAAAWSWLAASIQLIPN